MAGSLLLPALYLTGLGLAYYLFTQWNQQQKRLGEAKQQYDSYFGRNLEREIYLELCEQYSPENQDGLKILMTNLMKRAVVGVSRLMKLRDEKGPLTALVKQGAVGEELLERMAQAEKEIEEELTEVGEDADFYKPGWKGSIFQEASQVVMMQAQMEARRAAEQEQEDKRRASTSSQSNTPTTLSITEANRRSSSATSPASVSTPASQALSSEEDEKRRERLAQELIEEEEREKKAAAKQQEKERRDSATKKNKNKK